jgi:L-lysine epsilon oxidase-like protein
MLYKIYPPIGIARVGNSSTGFFIGPETPEALGTELQADGSERPVERFKDETFRVKRQAARFRIFEFDEAGGAGRPARFPAGTVVEWTVALANKKDAVVRNSGPTPEDPTNPPPPLPTLDNTRANRAIAAQATVKAPLAEPVRLEGSYLTGTPRQEGVFLGELRMDRDGNLLVLGGRGISRSPEGKPIGDEVIGGEQGGSFYNNRGWYDDVSDGSVTAEIRIPGQPVLQATPAWVAVGPPDFAPATAAVVTLYDVLFQVAIDRGERTGPARPSFSRDVWPMLRRAAGLAWVNRRPTGPLPSYWSGFSTDWAALSDASPAAASLRQQMAQRLKDIRPRRALANFNLRKWQQAVLDAWVAGDFVGDFDGKVPDEGVVSPETLTRTALDATAGQGFFPGIEAGIVVTNPTLYAEPFRIASHVRPGDLTALMALPWQADFLDCAGNWWPSQRPDVAAQPANPQSFLSWIRPLDRSDSAYRDLVANFGRLGVIAPRKVGGQDVLVEVDRDPTF